MLAETRGINNGIKEVNGRLAGFGKTAGKVSGLMKVAFAGVAAKAVFDFGKATVNAASDAQQSLGATETVFGKAADSIVSKSKKAADAVGLSANVYRENANLIGSLFANKGLKGNELAKQTDLVIKKGADLSATFGGDASSAVEALSSAFKGEFDPLERYGISIKQSTISTEAAALAHKKYGKDLKSLSTEQQNAISRQATMNLINKQSAKSVGAFGKESDTLAHQTQVLGAQWDNLKVTLGSKLLPIVTKVFTALNKNFVPAVQAVSKYAGIAKDAISGFFGSSGDGQSKLAPVVDFIKGKVIPGVTGIGKAYQGLLQVVLPIVQQIVAGFMSKWSTIQPALASIWNSIKSIITSALSIIRSIVQIETAVISAVWSKFGATIVRFLSSSLSNVIQILKGAFQIISGVFKVVSSLLKGDWKGAWNGIKQILSGALNVIKGIIKQTFNIIRTVISAAWIAVKAITKGVWSGIKAVIGGIVGGIKAVISGGFRAAKAVISSAWNGAKSVTSSAWNGIKSAVSNAISGMMGFVRSIPGKVKGALGNLGSLLYNAGKSIIQGLLDGIESMIGAVESKLNVLTSKIPDWKGPKKRDKKLLRPTGRWIIEGLVHGFEDGTKGVHDFLGKLTDRIAKYVGQKYAKATAKSRKVYVRQVIGYISEETRALMKHAAKRQKIYDQLANAQKKLADLVKARADYAASVKSAAIDAINITGLNSAFTPQAMIQQMAAQLNKLQRFASLVMQLKKSGLNKTAINQIVAAGVDGGLATAEAIASGGKSAITEFNSLQKQIDNTAGVLGDTAASSMYDAGVKAAEGLVKGLKSKAKALEKVANQLARNLTDAIDRALGGHGNSGHSAGTKHRQTAPRASTPKTAAPAAKTSNSAPVINITVQGDTDPARAGREIAKKLDAYYAQGGRRSA